MQDEQGDVRREERQREIRAVLLKALGVVVTIAMVIWLGSWVIVKTLGLDDVETPGAAVQPLPSVQPLPTTALPDPSDTPGASESPEESDEPSPSDTPTPRKLDLSASPSEVRPMGRIDLTGRWPGHDAVRLSVQRFESGRWIDFGVSVQVRAGAFGTYVMTGRTGEQRFRVFDPATRTASNPVRVTVG